MEQHALPEVHVADISWVEPFGGTETILIAEDESALRRMLRRTLEPLGYTILEAGDAEEALKLVAAHVGTIHLLLSNVNLPGMSGPALVERLVVVRPDLRIIYVSGSPLSEEWVSPGRRIEFLQKPFTRERLTAHIRQCLDRTQTDD